MGTQFSSRLSKSDSQRILAGIRAARSSVVPSRGGSQGASSGGELPAAQRRRLADALMPEILTVAEQHHFSDALQESNLFSEALDWLKKLQSDARFNEFGGIIQQYGLESSANPVAELTRQLREIMNANETSRLDPFRTAASGAARTVLGQIATRPGQNGEEGSPAARFGRKLASVSLQELLARFIGSFIGDLFASLVSRADPDRSEAMVSEAMQLSREKAERIGKQVVKRIEEEGKITDTPRIRAILNEELRSLLDPHGVAAPARP